MMKGIITDLDGTLWNGIVGDDGANGVSWVADPYASYQRCLEELGQRGVLLAVASKNSPNIVQEALQRPDLLFSPKHLFPLEVHWRAKSESITRILATWNIDASDVVFIDDNPMELAEVAAVHPRLHCVLFPTLLDGLQAMFAADAVPEDALRLDNIRRGQEFQQQLQADPEAFLASLEATVTFDFNPSLNDPRVLQLVNKVNQFNLNGIRRSPEDWIQYSSSPHAVTVVINYKDRFGPLGKISVIQGMIGYALYIHTWVLSCRAFSRQIEYQCIQTLFQQFGVKYICFEFQATERNQPLQDFLSSLHGEPVKNGPVWLSREQFQSHCPSLYHRVQFKSTPKNYQNLTDRLARCFQEVFPLLTRNQTLTASQSNTNTWDSLRAVTLIAVIEEEFGVEDLEQLVGLDSFAAIHAHLESL